MGQPGGEPYDPNAGYEQPQYAPQDHYVQPGYAQPGYAQPGYAQPGYAQPGYAQPGYAQPAAYYPAPYPQPYAVAGYPPAPGYGPYALQRPGQATTAAVLGYVAAGLLIAAGILLFFVAAVVHNYDAFENGSHPVLTAELVIDGLLNLLSGALLIAGAASLTGGAHSGRILLSVGSGIVLAESIYFIARTGEGSILWALIYAALVIVAMAMAWTRSTSTWLRAAAQLSAR